MQLKGKRIALTGGAGGIGSVLADKMLRSGAHVTVIDRNPAADIVADLGSEESLSSLTARLAQAAPDVLVNLAGLLYFGGFAEQQPAQLATMMKVNLEAPMRLAQAVIPAMRGRGRGHIVNIGSVFGLIPFPHFVTYSATKAGLKGFSDSLRREYAGKGITVTHISPRAVKTSLNNSIIEELHRRTNVSADDPERVAAKIVAAIEEDRSHVVIGFPESLFAHVNGVAPGIIDHALLKNRDIAEALLGAQSSKKEKFHAKAA
jgi:short-subunit dehydrogenase